MKKIGLVLSQPPGYSETFFNSKIKGLQDKGHEITLFTGHSKETYKLCMHKKSPQVNKFLLLQAFNVCLVGFKLLPHIKAVQKFMKLERRGGSSIKRIFEKIYLNANLLQFKGDWLHYGFATLVFDRELVAQAVGAKMAVSFRGFDINVYPLKYPNCYQLLWKQVDKVHTISAYLLEKAYLLGLTKAIPSQIITPAVDLKVFPKRAINRTSNALKIVTIARFNWIKGIDYLIEVATYLKKANLDFEWQLIGSGHPFERERYVYHIHEAGLEHLVILKGELSHQVTLQMLTVADVYVQTSLNEGFCNAVLEAQAVGVPCVAFKVGGLPENISDTKTGWLIEPYDVNAMARTIIKISEFETTEKDEIAKLAINRVRGNFDLDAQKLTFHEFYTC
ncbi:glycosyltransferase family 4 protein [Gelidibacter japonicus]|uniref:glycosyltransferase family 4 protein n=1 Tax=Gelidibacter japonicus TaxID=1962232 RepID=UPI002021B5C5|nr:glycosyltransferase family 4 protein [Gelidibacter japonicus]MCL8006549.1 glycosyltransferase family 4 protein [Gelidibacter japonicus]